jgi:diaminopimelate epimerase
MRFEKCHGAGNDFVVIDARDNQLDWSDLARKMCDRHYGVGSDGLILVGTSKAADLSMRMFNPDGSESEACGNGLRCFIMYAVEHQLVRSDEFDVETAGGTRHVKAFSDASGMVFEAEAGMGLPRFAPDEIPAHVPEGSQSPTEVVLTIDGTATPVSLVSMGNPHAVCFLKGGVNDYPLGQRGPLVEHHELFPARVNFEIVFVRGRHDVDARVWERGAGETLACGSGACAIAVAALLRGHCDSPVRVHLPGGQLTVTWGALGTEVLLRGPVQRVFDGNWPD